MFIFSNDTVKLQKELKDRIYKSELNNVMTQNMISYIAKNSFTIEEYRIILQLILTLEYTSFTEVKKTDLAKKLNMKPQNIGRSMNNLVRKNVLIRFDNSKLYKLNSSILNIPQTNNEISILKEKIFNTKNYSFFIHKKE